MAIIKTEEYTLRPIKTTDAKAYFETMQDKETKKSLNSTPQSLQEAKKEIHEMIKEVKEKDSEIFTIEVKGKFAGNIVLQHQNFDPQSKEGRMHIWIHPQFRGRGLATHCFDTVLKYGLKSKFIKIFVQCKASNEGMIQVIKKAKFTKVKTFVNEKNIKKILWVKK